MKLIACKDYTEMSQKAANEILELVHREKRCTLGLATGSTPEGVYKVLVEDFNKGETSYKHVSSVNLDEYVGLAKDNPNSYHHYMKSNLFQHIDLPESQQLIPNGEAKDLEEECRGYEKTIAELGGVDLQLLGIGHNGHIGFNEPGTPFTSRTHVVDLAEKTRKANARFFSDVSEVPTQAITMGIETILESKKILLLISGKSKAEALSKLMNGPIDESFPASILKNHPNVTIMADEEAMSLLEEEAVGRQHIL